MRTPLWESSSGALLSLLNSGVPFFRAELLTFVLKSGTIVRLTNYDTSVTVNGTTWVNSGPIFSRSNVTHKRGVEVDTMELEVSPKDTDLLGPVPWLRAIRAGALDYATVMLDICVFAQSAPLVPVGTYSWFYGQVDEIPEYDDLAAKIKVVSDLARLNILMPRNLVQPGCLNTLFDAACGLSKDAFDTTTSVSSVNPDGSLVMSAVLTTDYFNEGELVILDGDNANVVRKIKNNVSSTVFLFAGFVFPITGGTTVRLYPGCDKTKATCQGSKFGNNVARFRGIPFVPAPETVL